MQGRRGIFCYFILTPLSLRVQPLPYIYFFTARKRFSTFTFVQPRRGFFLPLHDLHELLMEVVVGEWRGIFDFCFVGIDGVDGVVE